MAQNMVQTMAPTTLSPFKKSPTAVQMAAVAITYGHNIVVAIFLLKMLQILCIFPPIFHSHVFLLYT